MENSARRLQSILCLEYPAVINLAETTVWEYEKLALDELASLPGGHWHELLATSFSYPRHMNVGYHPPSLLPSGLNSNSVYSY